MDGGVTALLQRLKNTYNGMAFENAVGQLSQAYANVEDKLTATVVLGGKEMRALLWGIGSLRQRLDAANAALAARPVVYQKPTEAAISDALLRAWDFVLDPANSEVSFPSIAEQLWLDRELWNEGEPEPEAGC